MTDLDFPPPELPVQPVTRPPWIAGTLSVLIAVLGVLVARHPENAWLKAIHSQLPLLNEALPYLLTALATAFAWATHPPAWLRKAFGKAPSPNHPAQ